MTNPTAASTSGRNQKRTTHSRLSDVAPMVVTRLSGWIDMTEPRAASPAWIIPTRVYTPAQ